MTFARILRIANSGPAVEDNPAGRGVAGRPVTVTVGIELGARASRIVGDAERVVLVQVRETLIGGGVHISRRECKAPRQHAYGVGTIEPARRNTID